MSAGVTVGETTDSDVLRPLAATADEISALTISSSHGDAFNLPQAHTDYPYRGDGYTVAVIDSGIDYNHPAFSDGAGHRIIGGWDFVDGRDGRWVEGDSTLGPDRDAMDYYGHGTMVAGIIGAQDDVYSGVAPQVNLVSLRVLDAQGNGDIQWLADALQWVINNQDRYNIVAVNMSVGVGNHQSPPPPDLLGPQLQTLAQRGVFVAAAAGNEYFGFGSNPGLAYPAVSNTVVSVGAAYDSNHGSLTWPDGSRDYATDTDRIASFSQRSSKLDLFSPGAVVTSTQLSHGGNAHFGTFFGTSLAAAQVTGSAVLVHEALDDVGRSDLTGWSSIRDVLKSTGKQINDGDDESDNVVNTGLDFSLLDLDAALDHAVSLAAPLPPPPAGDVDEFFADAYEPNETLGSAPSLGTLSDDRFENLSLHVAGDNDWYRFNAQNESLHRIAVEAAGSLDSIELTFHDVTKNRERHVTAAVVNGVASLDVELREGVNYFLEINSPAGETGTYSLAVTDLLGSINPPPPQPLTPDKLETNDAFGAAAYLGAVGQLAVNNLSLHDAQDQDWFRFQVTAEATYELKVAVNVADLTLTFHDVSKNRTRDLTANVVNGIATINVDLRDKVNYFLEVRSVSGGVGTYSLTVAGATFVAPAIPPDQPDSYETNETLAGAWFLGHVDHDSVENLTLHNAGDVDWFRFQANDRSYVIEVEVLGAGQLNLTFEDVSKNRERTIALRTIDGRARLEVDLRSGVNYFLKLATDGAPLNYRLTFA